MMSDGSTQDNIWPLPKFHFEVSLGSQDSTTSFQEISGLETETQVIEYRHGDSKQFSTIKMPGISKVGNVTLKKGIFVKDNKFYDWYKNISMNTIKRETVVIKLLDQNGNATMTWTLSNAWPTKVSGTDMKSDSNEVAVETLELAYETLVIANK
ncbi:MAG: phage tail protein [Bacteroidetes bacterium]|nr:MAG: phage tail protein [Bacteroidota bacterium]